MRSEALPCRKSESKESKDKTSKKEGAYSTARSAATKFLKVRVPSVLGLFGGVVKLGVLPWANLSVVLCELDEGFKGLWVSNQYRRVRQTVIPTEWWYSWT